MKYNSIMKRIQKTEGLTDNENNLYNYLIHLSILDDEISNTNEELCDAMGFSTSLISKSLRKLEKNDKITREFVLDINSRGVFKRIIRIK